MLRNSQSKCFYLCEGLLQDVWKEFLCLSFEIPRIEKTVEFSRATMF